jgi:hypothetical protein
MASSQTRFFDKLKNLTNFYGMDLVVDYEWANTGIVRILWPDQFEPIMKFSFSFQKDYCVFYGLPMTDKNTGVTVRIEELGVRAIAPIDRELEKAVRPIP